MENKSNIKFKLFRFGKIGEEKPAVEYENGLRIDISAFTSDFDDLFFTTAGIHSLNNWLENNSHRCPRVDTDQRYGSCISRPSKIVAIGLNYKDHAEEAKLPIPTEPIIFLKAPSSLSGPNDKILIPKNSEKLDWEAELGIVIGKKASLVGYDDAENFISGFTVVNDVSERSYQMERGGEWTKGKSLDSFCPTGPYLVPIEFIPTYQQLEIKLSVNDKIMQHSNTSNMIFDVKFIVSYVSQFMTLLPGDLIITGTPAGVGFGHTPPVFLKKHDQVTTEIEKLGKLFQTVQ